MINTDYCIYCYLQKCANRHKFAWNLLANLVYSFFLVFAQRYKRKRTHQSFSSSAPPVSKAERWSDTPPWTSLLAHSHPKGLFYTRNKNSCCLFWILQWPLNHLCGLFCLFLWYLQFHSCFFYLFSLSSHAQATCCRTPSLPPTRHVSITSVEAVRVRECSWSRPAAGARTIPALRKTGSSLCSSTVTGSSVSTSHSRHLHHT